MKKPENNTGRHLVQKIRSREQSEDFDAINEFLDNDEDNGGSVVFDEMLDSNQKTIDSFFTIGRHQKLDDY